MRTLTGFVPKVRFAVDSPLEESGFEPLVPLTLNPTNAGEHDEKTAIELNVAAEPAVRTGLTAGASRIRTLGPTLMANSVKAP
jgi:hypothetical protein